MIKTPADQEMVMHSNSQIMERKIIQLTKLIKKFRMLLQFIANCLEKKWKMNIED